jgi:acetylornithine/N-succinyldiaminopimelate aminotransferase
LGGGFPIGAVLTTQRLAGAMPVGTHGSTFGGNALASAAGLAVLRALDEGKIVEAVSTKGTALGSLLKALADELPDVCEGARGEGLLWGLVLRPDFAARTVVSRLQERGVLVIGAGERVLRFCPPLVVTIAELEEGVRTVREVLRELLSLAA